MSDALAHLILVKSGQKGLGTSKISMQHLLCEKWQDLLYFLREDLEGVTSASGLKAAVREQVRIAETLPRQKKQTQGIHHGSWMR